LRHVSTLKTDFKKGMPIKVKEMPLLLSALKIHFGADFSNDDLDYPKKRLLITSAIKMLENIP
jgi:hypothetical protein